MQTVLAYVCMQVKSKNGGYRADRIPNPSTLVEYVQETGRDGKPSIAIAYQGNRARNAVQNVVEYESNTTFNKDHCSKLYWRFQNSILK